MRTISVGLAVVLVLVVAVEARPQTDRTAAEAQARRAAERLRALQREADELAAQSRSLLVDLRSLELQRHIRIEEAVGADRLLKHTSAALQDTTDRLARLEAQAQGEQPEVHARLVEIYKRGRNGYARMLFGLDDIRGLGRAYRLISAMSTIERRTFADYRETLEGLRQSRSELAIQLTAQTKADAEAKRSRTSADAAVAAHGRLVAEIDARRDLNAQLAGELQEASGRLQQSLASLSPSRPVEAEAVTLPLKPFRGEIDWPAVGPVVSAYGPSGVRPGRARPPNGVEIGLPNGADVRAVHEGSVAYAEPFSGFGRLVIVNHGGKNYSLYGYLSELRVKRGDRVSRGQTLGASGTSPTSAPALYFELRIDGAPVDPLQWLKRR
jgi:septal ring factor EnvC (AmiA/AmiB activator)